MRILIADGSVVYRNMLKKAITAFDINAVPDIAETCESALRKARQYNYDIVIADVELPADGELPEFISTISAELPDTLFVITTRPSPSNARLVETAMASGNVKLCISKPLDDDYNKNIETIKRKMRDVYDMLRERYENKPLRRAQREMPANSNGGISTHGFSSPDIILIASSTGGPAALETVLSGLDENIQVPIIIVQHMPPKFIENFRLQLQGKTKLPVKITENGEGVQPGTVYLARGGVHTKLDRRRRVNLDTSPSVNGVKPSADVLFGSVAEFFPRDTKVLVIVLTGMGNDGCYGVEQMKERLSCFCIAESENTCVVYGMPRAVADGGFADAVMDLETIADAVNEMTCSEVI